MTPHWATDAVFYHVYPLGLCGAPARNDFNAPPTPRLKQLAGWIGHWQALGVNALYLGPVFESTAHGYDTADYYHVDRRLGDNATLAELSAALHQNGLRLILDGVFNHVGRDFWAFRDVQQHGAQSAYVDWFQGINFSRHSPYGDAFAYEGWSGHYDLVKLNLNNPAVREHLFQAIALWVRDFGIDGLRGCVVGNRWHLVVGNRRHRVVGNRRHLVVGNRRHLIVGNRRHLIVRNRRHRVVGNRRLVGGFWRSRWGRGRCRRARRIRGRWRRGRGGGPAALRGRFRDR